MSADQAPPARTGSALIVDDVPYIRRRLTDTLVRLGWRTIYEAGTGREALISLRGNRFDLILLDVALPDVDGIELLAAVRRLDPKIIVVVVTAAASVAVVRRAKAAGAHTVLVKPVDVAYLEAFLDGLREGRRGGWA